MIITSTDSTWIRRYREEFGGLYIVKRIYRVFGIPVWRCVVAQEEFPAHADIDMCCLGITAWEPSIGPHAKRGGLVR